MNRILRALRQQRTTRRKDFKRKIIAPQKIERIKQAIQKTANASNRQSYSIIEVDRKGAEFLSLPGDYVFLFCIDFLRLKQLAGHLGKAFDSQYLMQFSTGLIDISLLAQSAVLAAQSMGIDTMITNEIYHNKLDKCLEMLEIPEKDVFPMIALCMGYGKKMGLHTHGRISPQVIFHKNVYKPMTKEDLENLIKEYDEESRHLGLIENWKDLGFKHYLDWFFEKWSPVIGSRKQSDLLLERLKEHGFL